MEAYKHYTFFSLRLENFSADKHIKEGEDVDFNILLFKNFIITVHDKVFWVGGNLYARLISSNFDR